MILTYEILHSAGTAGVGFNCHQLKVLGVLKEKGWLRSLIGTDITDERWQLVLALKGRHPHERKVMVKEFSRRHPMYTPMLHLPQRQNNASPPC